MRLLTAAYNQLAQTLRERILSGSWKAGARLPTERELCEQYSVSRITVRRALQILEEENLLLRYQGRGTFVNVRPARKIPIVNGDFSASILRHAPELTRAVREKRWTGASAAWARALGIAPGARVLFVRRLDCLQGRPIAMDEVVLIGRYAAQLTNSDFEAVPFEERWQARQRLAMDYESQIIEAVPAARPASTWLRVRPGTPLLKEVNVAYLRGGQPAGLFVSFYRHEFYQFNSMARFGDSWRAQTAKGRRRNAS